MTPKLPVESLERRRLLDAVTAVITADRVLEIQDTVFDELIELHSAGGVTTLVTSNGHSPVNFPNAEFDRIDIRSDFGQDTVTLGDDVLAPATIENRGGQVRGGGGNDIIIGRGTLNGGAGDDRIRAWDGSLASGGGGSDTFEIIDYTSTLQGDGGDDTFLVYSYHWIEVTLDGGSGEDVIYFSAYDIPPITGGGGHLAVQTTYPNGFDYSNLERVVATNGDDSLTLTDGDSLRIIEGLDGNDTMIGSGRGELFIGGSGNDCLLGGGGDDALVGGSGDDYLNSGLGRDTLIGGSDSGDVLVNKKHDVVDRSLVSLGQKQLNINGTSGNDVIRIEPKSGAGGSKLRVYVNGKQHGQFPISELKTMHVGAGAGDDSVFIGPSILVSATVYGDAGDDHMSPGRGWTMLNGGKGGDTIDYSGYSEPLRVGIGAGPSISDGHGWLYFETLLSGSGDDSISLWQDDGFAADREDRGTINYIDGGGGDDQLGLFVVSQSPGTVPVVHGGDGDDTISVDYMNGFSSSPGPAYYFGDSGNDRFNMQRSFANRQFNGGSGIDFVYYRNFTTAGAFTITLDDKPGDGPRGYDNVHSDVEMIQGSFWGNTIIGGDKDETLIGAGWNDLLIGNGGDDVLIGGGTLKGGDGDDSLVGADSDDVLDGGAGDDTLLGNYGNDTLIGGPGDDVLDGGDGKNVIIDESRRSLHAVDLLDELRLSLAQIRERGVLG
jgi:Ca2+-binding RTX toxin-like protein